MNQQKYGRTVTFVVVLEPFIFSDHQEVHRFERHAFASGGKNHRPLNTKVQFIASREPLNESLNVGTFTLSFLRRQERRVGFNIKVTDLFRGSLVDFAFGYTAPGAASI